MDSVDSREEDAPLVLENSSLGTPRSHARDVHILSSAFLLIFLAYGAAQNLESTLNTVSFCFNNLHTWVPFDEFCRGFDN